MSCRVPFPFSDLAESRVVVYRREIETECTEFCGVVEFGSLTMTRDAIGSGAA
jgi:hypothetical protein